MNRWRAIFLITGLAVCSCQHRQAVRDLPPGEPVVATYSIVAFDPDAQEWGVAVQSKFFGVGSVVPWARAKDGAIATQAFANVGFGSKGLELLKNGSSAEEVVRSLIELDPGRDRRQLAVVDRHGHVAAYTGKECMDWAGHKTGTNYSVQGNLLKGEKVVEKMAQAFEEARDREGVILAEALMEALLAGEKAGGDRRGRQSAALLVVREKGGFMGMNDRYVDLRVEDHTEPLLELERLLKEHRNFFPNVHKK